MGVGCRRPRALETGRTGQPGPGVWDIRYRAGRGEYQTLAMRGVVDLTWDPVDSRHFAQVKSLAQVNLLVVSESRIQVELKRGYGEIN